MSTRPESTVNRDAAGAKPSHPYEYSGYLSTILSEPEVRVTEELEGITFTRSDLMTWRTEDLEYAIEWRHVPCRKRETEEGVQIEGDFQRVVAIDSLSPNDPRFWAPLTTIGLNDDRFPIDVSKYPVIEITYRCTSERAHPTWMWLYEGGSHFGALPKSQEWRTVVRGVQHFGFPERIEGVVLRLYSPTRTVESFEVKSIRFRAMSDAEARATKESHRSIDDLAVPKRFPVLDEFMPLGVYMDAASAKRLAAMLGITEAEYWDLVIEDLVVHDHNAIALAHFDKMKARERERLLKRCADHGIRIIARHEFPVEGSSEERKKSIERHVKPYRESAGLLAHTFSGEPVESDFLQVLKAKDAIEKSDPNHPVALVARYPNAYPLFAKFFSASGVGHFTARRPWHIGKVVRTHVPLSKAQQFWVAAPAFVYPTRTPEWSSCPEMRLMVNLSMANGARGWFAYSYHNDPVWLRGRVLRTLTGPFLTFSDLWMELMQRMKLAGALAPMLLQARPEDEMDDWYLEGFTSDSPFEPMPGIPPISRFHLRGTEFSLYFTVSNNTREITSANIDIPDTAAPGMEIHDLTDYVLTQVWKPMDRQRHIEMFPGQEHVMLVASPEECEKWREIITSRLIDSDIRKLEYDLKLARLYKLEYEHIEEQLKTAQSTHRPEDFGVIHSSRMQLTDLIYGATAVFEARSNIISASSAVCACDGALCRLMSIGKNDRARKLGAEVIPLAREFTGLRLALRRGEGKAIVDQSAQLAQRSLALLERIRVECGPGNWDE